MLILYDDSALAPERVRQIIGCDRFGDVLRRKQRLFNVIETAVAEQPEHKLVRLTSDDSRKEQAEALERIGSQQLALRLPSCLMPIDLLKFRETLRKLAYAPGPAIFGGRFDDEAVLLMPLDELANLLRIEGERERRSYLVAFEQHAQPIDNRMGVIDLRDVRTFLAYMTGATETRAFNSADISRGVFRKRSALKEKMRAEHAFFHVVPDAMKRFLLPTFDWREDEAEASYAMEYLSIPDAAIQMVHHSFDRVGFDNLMDGFFDFLSSRMTRHVGVDAVRDVARSSILKKMHQRLAEFRRMEESGKVDRLLRSSNGYGLDALEQRADRVIERAIASDRNDCLAVSHGDPCLSNILFNQAIGLFRLIDPRGALSLDDAFQHPLYDLAKFSHSVLGNYDFVNNGLFECQLDENLGLQLELGQGGVPSWIRERFIERCRQAGHDVATLRAYEASLFLSMLPLHVDVPRKLPAFCLSAAAILDELEDQT